MFDIIIRLEMWYDIVPPLFLIHPSAFPHSASRQNIVINNASCGKERIFSAYSTGLPVPPNEIGFQPGVIGNTLGSRRPRRFS